MRLASGSGLSLLFLFCVSSPALALDAASVEPRPMAIGLQVDLFPTVVSAARGRLGYAPQIWLGLGHARLRLVGAYNQLPDALAFADGFRDLRITSFAATIDYTFGSHFDGWWIGGGFELWQRSIKHDGEPAAAVWSSTIATLGGGYIFAFGERFFVDPWAGVHATLNPASVSVGEFQYEPPSVVANASIKLGVRLDL